MLYEKIEYILRELSTVDAEDELCNELKLVAQYCDSSFIDNAVKYFRKVVDRAARAIEDRKIAYSLYIIKMILLFLKELKDVYPSILQDKDFYKIISIFFTYFEQVLRKKHEDASVYLERRNELIDIVCRDFRVEFYYRKKDRLVGKQYQLPF